MENKSMTATLRYAITSEKKMSVVAKAVRGLPANRALTILQYMPKKAAKILLKLIKSAIANAKNNLNLVSENLYIKKIEIGKGPSLKRVRPVGRSRMHRYKKHRSFVKVSLDLQ